MSTDKTYEIGITVENYPFIYTRTYCSGNESRLSSCSSSVTSNIQYCSNMKIVKLKCVGNFIHNIILNK